jgi:hypothetical protein
MTVSVISALSTFHLRPVWQDSPITVGNESLAEKVGSLKYAAATYRLFKLPDVLDDEQEDYGQSVVYKGMVNTTAVLSTE